MVAVEIFHRGKTMYKLRTTLVGHEQDVRGVVAPLDEEVVSCSRDGTVKLWNFHLVDPITIFHSPSHSFINSIEYVNLDSLIAAGGQDGMVYLCDIKSVDLDSKYQLIGHEGNICALHSIGDELISGSWDCSAKVWDLQTMALKYDLRGHGYAVWDVKILGNNRYLTCSADKSIKLWQGDREIQQYLGHSDVVRKLLVLSSTRFASCSNDGTIKIWDISSGLISTLTGHESFVYDLSFSNGILISTGEDRTARIWKLDDSLSFGEIKQVITIPAISIWCVAILPNQDFVVGSSDKNLYVFTNDSSRIASEEKLVEFKTNVEHSTISEQSLDTLNRTDIPGYDSLKSNGRKEGEIIMVKNPAGVIEAHQWSGGEWIKIGDVVGGTQSNDKKEYEGQKWDYLFDVDIKDGEPPLKLPYNVNENPYIAAERFLSKNELPNTYTEEVVKFINQNTEGFKLDQPDVQVENPYADRPIPKESYSTPSVETKIIPEKGYILFKEFKVDPLINGLKKFNLQQQDEFQFSESQLTDIEMILFDLTSKNSVQLINNYIPHIIKNWKPETKLLAYDLLRVSIPRVLVADLIHSTDVAQNVLDCFQNVFKEPTTATVMMMLKAMSNVIDTTLFIQLFIDPVDDTKLEFNCLFIDTLKEINQYIQKMDKQEKLYNNLLTSLSTLIFNISAYYLKNFTTVAHVDPLVEFISEVGVIIIESSSEAAYRLLIGYGNLRYGNQFKKRPSWIDNMSQYSQEDRFIKLNDDINKL